MAQHLETREFGKNIGNLEGCDEIVICVQVRNDLNATVERDNLAFDVFLYQPEYSQLGITT